jgi:anhydro-N-acetylmuramic acid kinase
MADRYIGLMSGTSLDGVDGVIYDFSGTSADIKPKVIAFSSAPFPAELRSELLALNSAGDNELHRAALAANGLTRVYAQVVSQLLAQTSLKPADICAIGAHGQTVRHRPGEFDGLGYTLQLNNPALLAELTGIDVVADFRSRDVAAGGQGAPLVPAFHQEVFTAGFATQNSTVAVLNIGGISNLSILGDSEPVLGFDCGPGNALMDYWCHLHTGKLFDEDGAWAASGRVSQALLDQLMAEPFISKAPPKSTGRDLFNPAWLENNLQDFSSLLPQDVQATLTEFTAKASAYCLISYKYNSKKLFVCGGGVLNSYLMRRLQAAIPDAQVASSDVLGLPPMQVEAAAFAWLARKAILRETASFKSVTGAQGSRILGAIYPA